MRAHYPSGEDRLVRAEEFKRFRSRVFALYACQAFGEALALIEEEGAAFPEFESDLYFWRACLAGRLGDGQGALAALREAAERGHWYHERFLRDPDLDIIRGSVELAALHGAGGSISALRAAGVACSVEEHEGLGHDYPREFTASFKRGLEFLRMSPAP